MRQGIRVGTNALAVIVLAATLGLFSRTAFAQFTKTIQVTPGVPTIATTTWYYLSCTTSGGIGSYTINVAPTHGTVTFADVSGPLPGCPTGSPSLPAVQSYYTWTDTTDGATSDFFELYYYLNGQVALVLDVTATLGCPSSAGAAQDAAINRMAMPNGAGIATTAGAARVASESISLAAVCTPPPTPKIIFMGNDITGTTQNVFVGQQIPLTVSLPSGTSPASDDPWNVSGQTVGGFLVSPTVQNPQMGKPLPVAPSSQATTFYWVTPGTFTVEYSYSVGGQAASVSSTFQVSGPQDVMVTTGLGQPRVFESTLIFGPAGSDGAGITFTSQATLPPENTGRLEWVQTIGDAVLTDIRRNGKYVDCTPPAAPSSVGATALDNVFPYALGAATRDSPFIPLLDINKEEEFLFSADMYLMWDPLLGCNATSTNCSSIPVPLGYVSWQLSMQAKRNPPSREWMSSGSGQAAPFNASSQYPQWTTLITNFPCR